MTNTYVIRSRSAQQDPPADIINDSPKLTNPRATFTTIDNALLNVKEPITAIKIIFTLCLFSFFTKYCTIKDNIPPPTKVIRKKKPTTYNGILFILIA